MSSGSFDPFEYLESKQPEPVAAVLEEREGTHGWIFILSINHASTTRKAFELSIAWVDHDFYTGGGVKPSKLAEVITQLAADALGEQLPARADAAMFRRRVPGFDDQVSDRLATTR